MLQTKSTKHKCKVCDELARQAATALEPATEQRKKAAKREEDPRKKAPVESLPVKAHRRRGGHKKPRESAAVEAPSRKSAKKPLKRADSGLAAAAAAAPSFSVTDQQLKQMVSTPFDIIITGRGSQIDDFATIVPRKACQCKKCRGGTRREETLDAQPVNRTGRAADGRIERRKKQ